MSLIWRILFLILMITLATTLANFVLMQYQQERLHYDSEKILVHTLVQSLRDTLVQDVIDGNKLRVTNMLKNIASHQNPIEYLYVTGEDNNIFAHSFEDGFPRYLLDKQKPQVEPHGIYLVNKYQTERELIFEYAEVLIPGLDFVLYIGINQSSIAEKLAANRQAIILAGLSITLVALFVAYLWGQQVVKPLSLLANKIKKLGKGEVVDFSDLERADPEIRQLATVFQLAMDERQQALCALREREQYLAITLNSIGDAVITTDIDGNVTHLNPIAEKLTGWTEKDAKGQSIKTIFPIIDASSRQPIDSPIDKIIETGEIVYLSNHTTLISRDGAEYQIADSAAPIRDKDNTIRGMVLVFNDVTEKYQLRLDVNKQLERFKELSNLALTLTGDPHDVFNTIAGLISRWLGVKVVCISEIRGDELFFLSVYADGKVIANAGKSEIGKTPCANVEQNREVQVYHRVTELFPEASFLKQHNAYSYCGFPAFDSLGKPISVTCLLDDKPHEFSESDQDLLRIFGQRIGLELERVRDQKQLKKQEEQIRHSQKMEALGHLTGGIAHDFNNMLGVIMGYANLLEEALIGNPKFVHYAQQIQYAGQRGTLLTKKLLSFAQQDVQQAEVININNVLLDEQHMLEKTLTSRIKLILDLTDELWFTLVDKGDLEDAILNMCINAMHAIEGQGQIIVQTKNIQVSQQDKTENDLKAGDYVLLSIMDTGAGMDEITRQRIFEPFFTTKGSQGTGLGLSQVYGFIERSGGKISVDSNIGQGTKLELYFPRYINTSTNKKTLKAKSSVDFKGNETILIVDDETALLKLTAEILSQQGYEVICAGNAKQALMMLENEAIDLLLSDVIMPDMSGYQLAAVVQKQYPGVKILLASGFTDDRSVDLVDDSLHQNILYKPYDSRVLLERIRMLFDE